MRFAVIFALCSAAFAQNVMSRPGVLKAFAYLEANHEVHLKKQIEISQVPAPTFAEENRAAFMVTEFRRVGLKDVEIDPRGNVLGWRRGKVERTLAIAAHLDTVFPAGTDVTVKRKGARLLGPGIADDGRGLATLLALVEAMNHAGIETAESLLFVANVCEEGLGDLQGIKYLLQKGRFKDRIKAFISIDGTSAERIVNRALASKRYRVTIRGTGGHSWGNFGRPNPAHALARVAARFADIDVPENPRTTYSVGRIGGGTSVNSIPFEAWMEVDMRSESDTELERLEQKFLAAVERGVKEENDLRAKSGLKLAAEPKLLTVRYGGATPESSNLLQSMIGAIGAMGLEPVLEIGSTDSNVPINMGIPAVTIGGGGRGGDHHSLEEWFEPEGAYKAVQQALVAVLMYDGKQNP